MNGMKWIALTAVIAAWVLISSADARAEDQATDEMAIRKAVESYVAAYNKKDASALAGLWSPDAVYTNRLSGEEVVGREEIEKQFAAIFADAEDASLDVRTNSVEFVSPNVAVERGHAKVVQADDVVEDSDYAAVYVKRDGQWLLDRVTEEDRAPSESTPLKELEWMLGTWLDQDDQNRVETVCQWTKNRNFMLRTFALSVGDQADAAGMQIIGWDPATKQIRSWVFDSDGGFGEGTWSKKGPSWYVQLTGTLPDGRKSSSVNIITKVDENTFSWQSINREVGGEILPNVDEVRVVRKPTGE